MDRKYIPGKLLKAARALRAFATAIESKDPYGAQTHAIDMDWRPDILRQLAQELAEASTEVAAMRRRIQEKE